MKEEYINFYSHILGRPIELLVTGHWGYPLLMFPTSMGNAFQNRDSGLLNSISSLINEGKIKTYNIGSIDFETFYGKHLPAHIKIKNYEKYTQFIKEELIPQIQKEASVHRIGLAGCSFGAYHAVNFAFKYPNLADFVIGLSGAYDITTFMKGHYDDNVYFNNPIDFMKNAETRKYNHLKIILGTSDWDICREDTLKFSHVLSNKKINHWCDEKKWSKHDWPLWNMAFPEYISEVIAY